MEFASVVSQKRPVKKRPGIKHNMGYPSFIYSCDKIYWTFYVNDSRLRKKMKRYAFQ